MDKILNIFSPPKKTQPEEIDLHSIDYDFAAVRNNTPTSKSRLNQERPQLLASPLELACKSHSAGFPHTSNPSYASANPVSACPDTIENEKSKQVHETTEQLASTKMSDAEHQAKKRKGIIVQSAEIKETGTRAPVRHEQSDIVRAFIASASTVEIYCDPTSQSKTITLTDQEKAKALLSPFYGRNQFVSDAASGNIKIVELFLAAHPETDAGPSEYSPSPLTEAAKNGHIAVVEALIPRASQELKLATLCAVYEAGRDEGKRNRLAPILTALAQSLDKGNCPKAFDAAAEITEARRRNPYYQWITDTLLDAWHSSQHAEQQ